MPRCFILICAVTLLAAAETYQTGIVYGRAGDVDLVLDLALPAERKQPAPAIVCIHGGGWIEGSRKHFAAVAKAFAREGFVAVTIDYRLAPTHPMPAQVQDAKCAVRFLRANAVRLGIDPNRIGAIGGSAGGHLALMLGLSGPDPLLDGSGGHPNVDSRVQAVVSLAGPSNMAREAWANVRGVKSVYKGADLDTTGTILFGEAQTPALVELCSPITHVDAHDPPVLSLHGDKDSTVPLLQSQHLHQKLAAAKVENTLVVMEGVNHNVASASVKGVTGQAITFFKQHLAAKP